MIFNRVLLSLLLIPGVISSGPLHIAVRDGDMARLLHCAMQKQDVNARDEYGNTPLHYLPDSQSATEVARFLTTLGANASLHNAAGFTPLTSSISNGWFQPLCALTRLRDKGGVNALDNRDRSPLNWVLRKHPRAVLKGNPLVGNPRETAETLNLLLKAGANPLIPDDKGKLPLHWAARHGCPASTQVLVGAMDNCSAKDSDGLTALHWAIYNYAACSGAVPKHSKNGDYLLTEAHKFCDRAPDFTEGDAVEVCRTLVAKTDINQPDDRGVSATNLLFGLFGVEKSAKIMAGINRPVDRAPLMDISKSILSIDLASCSQTVGLPLDRLKRVGKFYGESVDSSRSLRLALLGCIDPRYLTQCKDLSDMGTQEMSPLAWLCLLDSAHPVAQFNQQAESYMRAGVDPTSTYGMVNSLLHIVMRNAKKRTKQGACVSSQALKALPAPDATVTSTDPAIACKKVIESTVLGGQYSRKFFEAMDVYIRDGSVQKEQKILQSLCAPGLTLQEMKEKIEAVESGSIQANMKQVGFWLALNTPDIEKFKYFNESGGYSADSPHRSTPLQCIVAHLAGANLMRDKQDLQQIPKLYNTSLPSGALQNSDSFVSLDEFLQKHSSVTMSTIQQEMQYSHKRILALHTQYPEEIVGRLLLHINARNEENGVPSKCCMRHLESQPAEEIFSLLLERDDLTFALDAEGYSVFDYCAIGNYQEGLEQLLKYNEDHTVVANDELQTLLDKAIVSASKQDQFEVEHFLIDRGAQTAKLPEVALQKLYRRALQENNTELLSSLFKQGRDPNLVIETNKQRTLLHQAASQGNAPMVKFLLAQNGVKATAQAKGHTPLMLATDQPVVDLLTTAAVVEASCLKADAPAFVF